MPYNGPHGVLVPLSRAAAVSADLLAVLGIIFLLPFVILAIGTPIALCVGFLVWIAGKL
jgi:hypothetical protein